MKFIWYVTELQNNNQWGGTYVGYHQGSSLKNLGHDVQFADPVSDLVYLLENSEPDWIYLPVEFTQYPCYKNILHYKNIFNYKIIIGVGIFKKWITEIPEVDVYITQWYGPGVDRIPLNMHYIPHGYNKELHKPIQKEIIYKIVFVGRNQILNRNPKKYLYQLKDVTYFGHDWPYPTKIVQIEDLNKVYNQATICPNFHGSNQKGDFRMLNERTYQILACGGFQVCDYVPKMETFFPEESLVTAKSEKEWVFKVNYFLNNPDLRLPYIDKGMEAVKKFSYDKIMQKLINIIK